MINEAQEWGDFSEWLSRINECIEREQSEQESASLKSCTCDPTFKNLVHALHKWVQQIEEAPITTWKEELSVRGFDFDDDIEGLASREVHCRLWQLLDALANMRVFFLNTEHLSDRAFYHLLVTDIIKKPIAQVPLDEQTSCVIDIVGIEMQEDPVNWLQYYASNRERMEWAKQNPGKGLPVGQTVPHDRDALLPQP